VSDYLESNHENSWFYFAEPYPTHLPYNPPQEYYELFVDKDFQPSRETLRRMQIVRTRMICHPPDVKAAMEVGQEDALGDLGDGVHDRSSASVEFKPEDEPGIRALYSPSSGDRANSTTRSSSSPPTMARNSSSAATSDIPPAISKAPCMTNACTSR